MDSWVEASQHPALIEAAVAAGWLPGSESTTREQVFKHDLAKQARLAREWR